MGGTSWSKVTLAGLAAVLLACGGQTGSPQAVPDQAELEALADPLVGLEGLEGLEEDGGEVEAAAAASRFVPQSPCLRRLPDVRTDLSDPDRDGIPNAAFYGYDCAGPLKGGVPYGGSYVLRDTQPTVWGLSQARQYTNFTRLDGQGRVGKVNGTVRITATRTPRGYMQGVKVSYDLSTSTDLRPDGMIYSKNTLEGDQTFYPLSTTQPWRLAIPRSRVVRKWNISNDTRYLSAGGVWGGLFGVTFMQRTSGEDNLLVYEPACSGTQKLVGGVEYVSTSFAGIRDAYSLTYRGCGVPPVRRMLPLR